MAVVIVSSCVWLYVMCKKKKHSQLSTVLLESVFKLLFL